MIFEVDKAIVESIVMDKSLEDKIYKLAIQSKIDYPRTSQASLLAASTFIICKQNDIRINQTDVSRLFKVDGTSIRRDIQRILKVI